MKNSAQTGVVHVGLIAGLAILGITAYYISQNSGIFGGTKAASSRDGFSNLSAVLRQDIATFNFGYSGSSPNYKIDLATSSNMKQNLYRNFGQGSLSPLIVNNPQSTYPYYQCGKTLYWIIKATDERSTKEIKSSVQTARVDCSSGVGTTNPPSTPVPSVEPTPTPASSPSASPTPAPTASCIAQTKPASVTVEGVDGTWCYDPDGSGGLTTASYCQDSCSYTADYCDAGTNIVRDGACAWSFDQTGVNKIKVHCTSNGYDCVSREGKSCSAGACQ